MRFQPCGVCKSSKAQIGDQAVPWDKGRRITPWSTAKRQHKYFIINSLKRKAERSFSQLGFAKCPKA